MDQETTVLYLQMKGMGLDAFHEYIVRTLRKGAVACSTVIKSVRNARFAPKTEAATLEPAEGQQGPVDEAILTIFGEYPFSSVRELSRLSFLPRSTVHLYLTQLPGFTVGRLRWVPLFLTAEHKKIGVDMVGELLQVLVGQATH
jgi:hypothetical protein